jgi:hypothetical protein
MTPDDLDRILSSEDSLEPSSGFAMNVMDSVRRQAAEPPRPRFPWFRFAAGLAACIALAASGTVLLVRSEPVLAAMAAPLAPLAAHAPELGYAAAAVLAGLGLAWLPRWLHRVLSLRPTAGMFTE